MADTSEFLIHMYDATWEDLRHSRNQEWKLLEIITLFFVALIGMGIGDAYEGKSFVIMIVGFSIATLSILGAFITTRHRILFKDKMKVIINIENHMKINDHKILPEWKKVKFNVSYLMMIAYGLISLSAALYAIVGGLMQLV